MTSEIHKALARLAGNRHSDGTSSLISMEDRTIIIDGFHDLIVNTRAVPDVPELVRYRYDPWTNHGSAASLMAINPNGEYVRYDQAVVMIAEKDADLLSLSNALTFTDKLASQRLERAKTAEAELANIKQQAASETETIERLRVRISAAVDDFGLIQQRIKDGQIERAAGTAQQGEKEARTALEESKP